MSPCLAIEKTNLEWAWLMVSLVWQVMKYATVSSHPSSKADADDFLECMSASALRTTWDVTTV